MKKLFALMLALVMISTTVVALATSTPSTPSITIIPTNTEALTESLEIDYTYYRILEADIEKDPEVAEDGSTSNHGAVAYYVTTENRANALNDTGLFNVTKVDGQEKWYVELKDANTSADALVEAFTASSFPLDQFPTGNFRKGTEEEKASSGSVSAGYYYIASSLGTKIALQTLTAVTINEKNSYPEIEKKDDKEYAAIDEEVEYTVTVIIPESVSNKAITIYDTITKGLTLNTAVTVTGAVDDPAYTSATFDENSEYTGTDEKQYTIVIPADTVLANKGKTLTFIYKAKVNENAVVLEKEHNKAHLKYDNYTTVDKDTDVTTLAFDLQKVDSNGTTVLTGAEFKLYDAETDGNEIKVILKEAASNENNQIAVYRVAKEGEDGVAIAAGTARIEGLTEKNYYLEETKAPTGYNPLNGRITAAASANTSTSVIDYKVENNKGTELPSTGGMGTTIFYVVGGLLIIGAAIILVARRKAHE